MKTRMLAGLILAATTLAAQPGVKSPKNAVSNDALTQGVDLRTEDACIVAWNTDEAGYRSMPVPRLSFARNAPEFAFQKIEFMN